MFREVGWKVRECETLPASDDVGWGDVVILDLGLANVEPNESSTYFFSAFPDTPCVVYTSVDDLDTHSRVRAMGAFDVVPKENLNRLVEAAKLAIDSRKKQQGERLDIVAKIGNLINGLHSGESQ